MKNVEPLPILGLARDHVLHQYGGDIGKRREELVTPALVLDIDAAQRSIDHMAGALRAPGMAAIRPHYKTHKSRELARRQVEAGAAGLSTATVREAAVLAAAGFDDIFVVNTVSHPAKVALLAGLAARRRILVAADEADNAAALSAAAVRAGSELGIMVEVDTGMDRCGVDTAEAAVTLARRVGALPGLSFAGITGYEGHCSLTLDDTLRHERQQTAMTFFPGVADQIVAAGVPRPRTGPVRRGTRHLRRPGRFPAPGRRFGRARPGYSPTTVNWYDGCHVVRDDTVVDIWPVLPRGPGHHGLAR